MSKAHKSRSEKDDEKFALLCCYCADPVASLCEGEKPWGPCGRRLCEKHGPSLCYECRPT